MRIASIGGGPAGLYFAILMKRGFPDAEITVYERNKADDTFGWGVVFCDETLGNFESADPESYAAIRRNFAYWGDIETYQGGTCVRSTGHGFCGLSRKKLLEIFQERCRALGVKLEFQHEIQDESELAGHDLILAVDGINSVVRKKLRGALQAQLRLAQGALLLARHDDAAARPSPSSSRRRSTGLFQVHAYPFEKDLSTFIVECDEDTWKRAGLDHASEEETVTFCEQLFAGQPRRATACSRTARSGAPSRRSAASAGSTGTSC